MTTLKAHLKDYLAKCYPRGVSAIQESEITRAFNAGAMMALVTTSTICALPEAQAEEQLEALMSEATANALEGIANLARAVAAQPKP